MPAIRFALVVPAMFVATSYLGDQLMSEWALDATEPVTATPRRQLQDQCAHPPCCPHPPCRCTKPTCLHTAKEKEQDEVAGCDVTSEGKLTGDSQDYDGGTGCKKILRYTCDNQRNITQECLSPDGKDGFDCWICEYDEYMACGPRPDGWDGDGDLTEADCKEVHGGWAAAFSLVIHLIFMVCTFVPICIGSMYYRNKSMNTVRETTLPPVLPLGLSGARADELRNRPRSMARRPSPFPPSRKLRAPT
eukprot:COSAG01_NODE_1524_length_10019_cov_6.258367_12_plen_248_part_00